MNSLLRIISITTLGFLLGAGAVHAQRKYRIRYDRPYKSGDVFTVNSLLTHTQRVVYKMEERIVREHDSSYSIELAADAQVVRIDKRTNHPIITYTVRYCIRRDIHDTVDLLPAGAELYYAMQSGVPRLTVNDETIESGVLEQIEDVLLTVSDMPNDRDMGVTKPQAVGATWKVDMTKMTSQMRKGVPAHFDPKDVTGKGMLLKVSESARNPSMVVQVDAEIRNFRVELQQEAEMEDTEIVARFIMDLPIDETKPPISFTRIYDLMGTIRMKPFPDKPEVVSDFVAVQEVTSEFSYK